MQQSELIPHLFRSEFRKITAVLCRAFGMEKMEMAEDIAGETFLAALETWPYKGVPQNPRAWLYLVAKNKARNYLQRNRLFAEKIAGQVMQDTLYPDEPEIDLSEENISDSQLQMLFAICHPSLPGEAQVGLALRILCGFGIEEIANAFLTNKEVIQKRLFRAREKLRQEQVKIEMPDASSIPGRLDTVLTTLYLLFNEGYYSESSDALLREDLCKEAMRLTGLLIEYEPARLPRVHALLALMNFHASRFRARKDAHGGIILYDDQDPGLWDMELISRGAFHLQQATKGNFVSRYHLEAAIAYWHTRKQDGPEKWESILYLYNLLLQLEYSPMAALNRTYALSRVRGREEAIRVALQLKLENNRYYFLLLGELFTGVNREEAGRYFERALSMAKTKAEQEVMGRKLRDLNV